MSNTSSKLKAFILNRKASDPERKPDRIIKEIGLKPGEIIVDIGSGGGYFSFKFAKEVDQEGRVYALDTDPDLLRVISSKAAVKGLVNLKTILTSDGEIKLPGKVDYIFMRNVTHHMKNRTSYFKKLKNYLKSSGKIIIIEYEKDRKKFFRSSHGHFVPLETIIGEMSQAGFEVDKRFDFLTDQHFTIFKPLWL